MLMSSSFADWSTCQLSEKAVCGSGIKTRMLDCVRSDGKSVDLKYCEEVSGYLWESSLLIVLINTEPTELYGIFTRCFATLFMDC